jgi:hypothetical protein
MEFCLLHHFTFSYFERVIYLSIKTVSKDSLFFSNFYCKTLKPLTKVILFYIFPESNQKLQWVFDFIVGLYSVALPDTKTFAINLKVSCLLG